MNDKLSLPTGEVSRDRRQPDAGPGLWITDTEPAGVDTRKLRAGRLARIRDMMREKEYAALLLFDPNNQRYATGSRNMFGYFLRNSTRYFFVPTEGPVILFEYPQSAHVSTCLETIQEARNSKIVWSSVAFSTPLSICSVLSLIRTNPSISDWNNVLFGRLKLASRCVLAQPWSRSGATQRRES